MGTPPRLAAPHEQWERLAQKIVLSGGTKPFRDCSCGWTHICRAAGGLPFSKRGLYDHMSDQNKITILGPDDMGVMVVDFKTAKGQCLTISVPRGETAVLKYLQALMPYGLVIQDGAA